VCKLCCWSGREISLRIPDIHIPKAGFNGYERAHTKRSTVANDNEQRSAYRLCRHAESIRMSEIRARSCNSFFSFLFSLFPLLPPPSPIITLTEMLLLARIICVCNPLIAGDYNSDWRIGFEKLAMQKQI